ncbi:MAG TPA: sugar transferase [Pirellulales bacterium]|jgi:lipopolysaccharide/colanic/teichoic acid biosynthesis glycosyltransferase
MTLTNLVSVLRRARPGVATTGDSNLLPPHDFRKLLIRERARSDRSGDRFSLIVFAPADGLEAHHLHVQLEEILSRRLRVTDQAGWLDAQRLGVALPATSPRGAWHLAEDVCRYVAPLTKPLCRVYCYPSDAAQMDRSIPDNRRHGEDNQRSDNQRSDNVAVGSLRNGSSRINNKRNGQPAVDSTHADHERPVESLELLFVQMMPAWKRLIDIAGASLGLLVATPLFLMVAIAIKLSSPGPVFFRQWRSGRGGKPFQMIKFRSMIADAESRKSDLMSLNEQDGPAFKITGDPRITGLGKFLRDTSLDELPQLWNVLRGEMSLVGPRPLPTNESNSCLDWQRRRLDVTPGLTCIWQVRGRSQVTFNEWVRMDLEYIGRRSLWSDLGILLATVPAVITRRGAK